MAQRPDLWPNTHHTHVTFTKNYASGRHSMFALIVDGMAFVVWSILRNRRMKSLVGHWPFWMGPAV